jgi:hypothetical protein
MTKTEAQQKFPIGAFVKTAQGEGIVMGHASYEVAFIGLRTFIEVNQDGHFLGEFPASEVELIG